MSKVYKSVLVISDTQFPYHHADTFLFLEAIAAKINPDLVVHIGDEVDLHGISFHKKSPELEGPWKELELSRTQCWVLQNLFPKMTLLESNHGSLLYRRAQDAGIPNEMVKSYNDVLKVGKGWRWVSDLLIQTPAGPVYFEHGQKETALRVRNRFGISTVQGHRHQESYIDTRKTPMGVFFAMQVGCLINDKSYAFAYNKKDMNRPMLSTGAVIDGEPYLFRLNETKTGRWDGKVRFANAA